MKKRLLSIAMAFVLAVTTVWGGTAVLGKADAVYGASTEGGLLWFFKDASQDSMRGVSSPTVSDDGYVYMASGKTLYKIDAATGEKAGSTALSGSIGYNKIAPTVGGGKVFVPLGGAKVDIVNAATMALEKTVVYGKNQANHQSLTPAVYNADDNAIYLGSWQNGAGGTYAKVSLDPTAGSDGVTEIVTPADMPENGKNGFYWSGACADGDYVVFGSVAGGSTDTPATGDAKLYAWKKPTGEADAATLSEVVLTDSGSICSTVVEYEGSYCFTSKGGYLYKAVIDADGNITANQKAVLGGASTCTPAIENGVAYVGAQKGSAGVVLAVDLATMTVIKTYDAPADVKALAVMGDPLNGGKIYCTYNRTPGGIYEVTAAANYFIPDSTMQQYCISSIAKDDGGTLYYANDSNNLMAVAPVSSLITAKWSGADGAGNIAAQQYTGQAATPAVTVAYDGKTLSNGTDYAVAYSDNIYPGTATAIVKGKGTYKGTTILRFGIKVPAVSAQKTVKPNLYKNYNRIKVKWSSQTVPGAVVTYKVEMKKGSGSWTVLSAGTTNTSIHKKKLDAGKKYSFRITPYVTVDGKEYSATAKTASVYTLKKASKPNVKKASKAKIKISWKNINGETGYQISRSTKKSKTKVIKTIKKSSAKSIKLKASKNKKYYYKVRAYKTVDGKKIYGPWSPVKAYKLK